MAAAMRASTDKLAPVLLQDKAALQANSGNANGVRTVNVGAVKAGCPHRGWPS